MASVPTFEDIVEAGQREALGLPTRLTREIMETDGSDVNIAFASQGAMAEKVAAYAQGQLNAGRLATAASVSDEALEQLGASEYGGELRRAAESAIVPLRWVRDPGGASIVIEAGTLVATTGGVTFETAADVAMEAGQTETSSTAFPETVPASIAVATTAGEGGNVPAFSITQILSRVPDPTLVVSNIEKAAGGLPEQSPADYQAQLESVWVRARRGTLGAIEAAAATTPGVTSARAIENLDSDGKLIGRVTVQILGGGGATNSALIQRVLERVREYRCAGVPVTVVGLNPRVVAIVASGLIIEDGFTEELVFSEARRSLVAFISDPASLKAGATLWRASILGVLERTPGLVVPDGSLTEPTTDITPDAGEYLAADLDSISLSV